MVLSCWLESNHDNEIKLPKHLQRVTAKLTPDHSQTLSERARAPVVTTVLSVKGNVLHGQGTLVATGEVISLLEAKQTNISQSTPICGESVQPPRSGCTLDSNAR